MHRLRLQRIQACQAPRQRIFLDLLPLLFHCNHPGLPGYVTTDTPAGLADYQPPRRALLSAQTISKSFELKKRARAEFPIEGLFLMGSVGSVAYSGKSDLDLWLCHRSGLDTDSLATLRQKADLIEQWAADLGLEAHIFFIDPERFRRGEGTPISTESCGSVQHHLLLEEFYRTSLWLAGRAPAWWLVPPHSEHRYTEYLKHLLDNRFVNPADVIDLGGLEHVRPGEFLGGTLWHLHKAIGSPHKSLLKLLLMESYDAEYPATQWLCTLLKTRLLAGERDLDELDPYVLMFRKVEDYLRGRNEPERLELARQSFFLKVSEPMASGQSAGPEKLRRRNLLTTVSATWGWTTERLNDLAGQRSWTITRALQEQKLVERELARSYQGARHFAALHADADGLAKEEMHLLGRRLSAALERKPGKVERLNLNPGGAIESENFVVQETPLADDGMGWALSVGRSVPGGGATPIKKTRSLLEILAWLIANGFYRRPMNILLETQQSTLSDAELRNVIDALAAFMKALPEEDDTLENFARPPRIQAIVLFLNLGIDAEGARRDGLRIASSRSDALSYGHDRRNLIRQVDTIIFTSWREILVQQHLGLTGLLDCLAEVVNESGEQPPRLECYCFAPLRARTIATRVQQLYGQLQSHLAGGTAASRLVARGGPAFILFEGPPGALDYRELPDLEGLYGALAAPREQFVHLVIDTNAGSELAPLAAICPRNRPGTIQVFCLPEPGQVQIFLLDERGSLYHSVGEALGPQRLLGPYETFLTRILDRYLLAAGGIEYYLIERRAGEDYRIAPIGFQPSQTERTLNVRVFAADLGAGRTAYTIFCDDQEFSSMNSGRDVFAEAAAYIVTRRESGERYPIYITDIDVPPGILGVDRAEQLQTAHFLRYKRKIEDRLNSR